MLNQTVLVFEGDDRFRADYYPDYPGSISSGEDEKARIYCNDRIQRFRDGSARLGKAISELVALVALDPAQICAKINIPPDVSCR